MSVYFYLIFLFILFLFTNVQHDRKQLKMSYLALKKIHVMILLEMKFSKKLLEKTGYAKTFGIGVEVPRSTSKRWTLEEK